MSEESKSPAPAKSPDPAPAKSADAAPSAAKPSEGGKSARDSVGGASVGHYGYFSNIKTPEYKSGWDAIWGKGKGAAKKTKKVAAPKEPLTVALDFADLPPAARKALSDAAKAKLGRGKAAYDRADKAESLSWTIAVTVPR
jgi:hypothetical protein